jgi:hypothetical protein
MLMVNGVGEDGSGEKERNSMVMRIEGGKHGGGLWVLRQWVVKAGRWPRVEFGI